MMKKIVLFTLFIFLTACSSVEDCFKSSGTAVSKEIELQNFLNVSVSAGLELVLKQDAQYKVTVVADANFINDISFTIENNTLVCKYNKSCNFTRDYKAGTIYISAPNLENITSFTEQNISSDGILTYPIIRLIALDNSESAAAGDFHLNINNQQTVIETNFVSNFYLTGQTNEFSCNFYFGQSRCEAQNFIVQNVYVFQRGSNDMILHPVQSISGTLKGTGNIILVNNPTTKNIEILGTGSVIIQ